MTKHACKTIYSSEHKLMNEGDIACNNIIYPLGILYIEIISQELIVEGVTQPIEYVIICIWYFFSNFKLLLNKTLYSICR